MLMPHFGHGFAPSFLMAFSDFSSSRRFALSQVPECQGRLQDRHSSYSQYGQATLSIPVSFFCLDFGFDPLLGALCLLPQFSAEKLRPHFSLRQATYDSSAARRWLVTALSHLYVVSVCKPLVKVVTYVVKRAFDRTTFSAVWSRTASHSGNMQGR